MYVKASVRDEKSEKCHRFKKNSRIFHCECRFYIFSYIFLVYHAGYVLRHLNYAKCPRLSVSKILLDFLCVLFGHFAKKHVFLIANADFTYLAKYYNLIMQLMSCDT